MFDQTFADRFWKNVKKSKDCWEWLGQKDYCGYGVIKFREKTIKAHRIAFELATGKSPIGLCVLHRCDNPGCVNPKHLYLGTPKDNAMDRMRKGRGGNLKGEHNGRAKLSLEQIETIRDLFSTGAYSKVKLGKIFGVSDAQIGNIVRGIHWKEEYHVSNSIS